MVLAMVSVLVEGVNDAPMSKAKVPLRVMADVLASKGATISRLPLTVIAPVAVKLSKVGLLPITRLEYVVG